MTERLWSARFSRVAALVCVLATSCAASRAAQATDVSSLRIVAATAPTSAPSAPVERAPRLSATELFSPPALPQASRPAPDDEILLVSARHCGSRCDAKTMMSRIQCERLVRTGNGARSWQSLPWTDAVTALSKPLPTIVYVHGNRIERGEDRSQGLTMYRVLRPKQDPATPLRFIVFSWPSDPVRGLIKDYKVKGARTQPAAWQLAWTVDQMPGETPMSLVGYSYGARVVTGALHFLAGGEVGNLALEPRVHPNREPIRVALLAAAMKADWLRPGGYYGRAVTQTSDLLLVTNRRDPIMRFFHLTSEGNGVNALGYTGPVGLGRVTTLAGRIKSVDVTDAVGRHHALAEYLAAGNRVVAPLQQAALVRPLATPLVYDGDASTIAGRAPADARQ